MHNTARCRAHRSRGGGYRLEHPRSGPGRHGAPCRHESSSPPREGIVCGAHPGGPNAKAGLCLSSHVAQRSAEFGHGAAARRVSTERGGNLSNASRPAYYTMVSIDASASVGATTDCARGPEIRVTPFHRGVAAGVTGVPRGPAPEACERRSRWRRGLTGAARGSTERPAIRPDRYQSLMDLVGALANSVVVRRSLRAGADPRGDDAPGSQPPQPLTATDP